ncbi:MAG: hypothetical protein AABZ60_09985 [Planctomycetota bacterium]
MLHFFRNTAFKLVLMVSFFVCSYAEQGLVVDLNLSDKDLLKGQEVLNSFADFLSQQTKLPLLLKLENKEEAVVLQLKSKSYHFAFVDFGFYLKFHQEFQLKALVQEVPLNPEKFQFYLVTLKGKYGSIENYIAQKEPAPIMTSLTINEDFFRKIALGQTIPKQFEFKKKSSTPSLQIKLLETNKFSAILSTGDWYHGMANHEQYSGIFQKLDAFSGPMLSGHVLVQIGDLSLAPQIPEGFEKLSQSEAGASYLKTLEVQEFKPVKDEDFESFLQQFAIETPKNASDNLKK